MPLAAGIGVNLTCLRVMVVDASCSVDPCPAAISLDCDRELVHPMQHRAVSMIATIVSALQCLAQFFDLVTSLI